MIPKCPYCGKPMTEAMFKDTKEKIWICTYCAEKSKEKSEE